MFLFVIILNFKFDDWKIFIKIIVDYADSQLYMNCYYPMAHFNCSVDNEFILSTVSNSLFIPGVNMGYLENSYSNSNNGGSVNSQDSLWQMKMAAAANNSVNQIPPHHMNVERQNSYGYDPITHGGYGAVDDYAPYPHITTQSNHGDDYMRNSNNPSRQEYCSDPYAAVHKPKKRIEQHIGKFYYAS